MPFLYKKYSIILLLLFLLRNFPKIYKKVLKNCSGAFGAENVGEFLDNAFGRPLPEILHIQNR